MSRPAPAALPLAAFVLAAASLLVCGDRSHAADRAANSKPNFIHLVADELGYYELSHMGHPHHRTPNLDRFAAEGLRFTRAYAGSSVCAPTRCCLMTGKHAGHASIRVNGGGTPLRADEPTTASVLKQAGYATGGFGKWGCGGRGSTGVPEKHGFDVFLGYYDQVHAHSYFPAYLVRNSEEVPLPGNVGGRTGKTYAHDVIHRAALDFLRANKDRPFFLYLPYTPPHGLFDIPESDPAWQVYRDKTWPLEARRYAAMVHMVDRHVGEILALLKELNLDEKTLFLFSGDNGGMDYFPDAEHPRGFHGPNVDPRTGTAFRGQKGTLYEGGLRVPFLARWPGKIAPDRTSEHVLYFPDVLPTLAELAGVAPPADIDGISFVPELLGEAVAGRRSAPHDFLYWELADRIAVRKGQWKAVRPAKEARWELYEVEQDPSESQDRAAGQPEILAQLRRIAEESHRPAVEGTFADTKLHERDRNAKFGPGAPRPTPKKK